MGNTKGNAMLDEQAPEPNTVILERADLMHVLLMHERKLRIAAEQRAVELEERAVIAELSAKYGVDMKAYTVVVDEGVARRNQPAAPPLPGLPPTRS